MSTLPYGSCEVEMILHSSGSYTVLGAIPGETHSTVTARSQHVHSTVIARSQHGHSTVTARSQHGHREAPVDTDADAPGYAHESTRMPGPVGSLRPVTVPPLDSESRA